MYVGLHVKRPLFLSDFFKLEFSVQISKNTEIKFHENPSSGSQVVPCGWAVGQTGRQTGMPKLIVAFHNFSNAHKKTSMEMNKPQSVKPKM